MGDCRADAGIENILKRICTTNGGIKMSSTDGVGVLISVATGVATGIFVALLFELKSWLKNRLARKSQIAYIRTYLHEQKELIAEITDEDYINVPKGLPQSLIFEATLSQAKIIVETRSPNLTNEQRSEILRSVSGISNVIAMFRAKDKVPETKFLLDKLQEIGDIKWLTVN